LAVFLRAFMPLAVRASWFLTASTKAFIFLSFQVTI
jgi:hypothetical protein